MSYSEDADESGTIDCPECGKSVYEDADRCPSCGNYIVRGGARRSRLPMWMVLVAIGMITLMLWLALSG